MPLQQQLRNPTINIPKHDTAILAPRHNVTHPRPCTHNAMFLLGGTSHTEDEIPMPLKRPQTLPAEPTLAWSRAQLPHLDRLVQRPGDQFPSTRRKRDRVHAVFMTLLALCAHDNGAGGHIPDADALIKGAGGDEVAVRRDGNGGDAVFDLQGEGALRLLHVPDADGAVAGAGGDDAAVARPVQGVDVLVVAAEGVADHAGVDVPDLYYIIQPH